MACAYTLVQHGRPICITPTQHAKLFGGQRVPRVFGMGKYAYAYPGRRPGLVVKITRDKTDVAGLVRAKGKGAPKVYHAYKLPGSGLHALVVEKLKLLPREWDSTIACFRRVKGRGRCCDLPGGQARTCKKMLRDLSSAYDALARKGIKVRDIHGGNVGRDAKGRWKFLDLGQSRVRLLSRTVKRLAGA